MKNLVSFHYSAMRLLLPGSILIIIFARCSDSEFDVAADARLKTKYIYSSSTASEPYAFITYTYDDNWNLIKELLSDYPKPPTSSYTYHYDSYGRLIKKRYKGKNGYNHSNQTESAFSVIREYNYQYMDELQIETLFRDGELSDSVIYKRDGDLILEENHFSQTIGEWSIVNEYNSDGLLIKKTELPINIITVYYYDNSRLSKTEIIHNNDEVVVDNTYTYSKSGIKEIVEVHYEGGYGEFLSEKTTYVNGNAIEYIKYHPTFQGSEWFCHRYEYY